MAYLVFFSSKNHKSDCGAAGEVRDCHKSSFFNESAELRLLCSDEGWDRKGSEGIWGSEGRVSQIDDGILSHQWITNRKKSGLLID